MMQRLMWTTSSLNILIDIVVGTLIVSRAIWAVNTSPSKNNIDT